MKPEVLLLDDDYNWLEILLNHMLQKHYILKETVSLKDALERLKVFRYPVVVVDMILGGDKHGGFKFINEARIISKYTQVIIITGYANGDDRNKADDYGVLGYFTKPTEPQQYKKLDDWILMGLDRWFLNVEGDVSMGFLSEGRELTLLNALTATRVQPSGLRLKLVEFFNEQELKDICFDLSIDYGALPGEGKNGKVRELISYLGRRERLPELIRLCRGLRSNISW